MLFQLTFKWLCCIFSMTCCCFYSWRSWNDNIHKIFSASGQTFSSVQYANKACYCYRLYCWNSYDTKDDQNYKIYMLLFTRHLKVVITMRSWIQLWIITHSNWPDGVVQFSEDLANISKVVDSIPFLVRIIF